MRTPSLHPARRSSRPSSLLAAGVLALVGLACGGLGGEPSVGHDAAVAFQHHLGTPLPAEATDIQFVVGPGLDAVSQGEARVPLDVGAQWIEQVTWPCGTLRREQGAVPTFYQRESIPGGWKSPPAGRGRLVRCHEERLVEVALIEDGEHAWLWLTVALF